MVKKFGEAPEGINILAVLCFVGALIFMSLGMFVFSFADSVKGIDPSMLAAAGVVIPSTGVVILVGLFLVAFSVLCYFLAKGLLAGKNWARVIVGVGAGLSIVLGIIGISNGTYIGSASSTIVNGLIFWYLFFKEDTKKFFK